MKKFDLKFVLSSTGGLNEQCGGFFKDVGPGVPSKLLRFDYSSGDPNGERIMAPLRLKNKLAKDFITAFVLSDEIGKTLFAQNNYCVIEAIEPPTSTDIAWTVTLVNIPIHQY